MSEYRHHEMPYGRETIASSPLFRDYLVVFADLVLFLLALGLSSSLVLGNSPSGWPELIKYLLSSLILGTYVRRLSEAAFRWEEDRLRLGRMAVRDIAATVEEVDGIVFGPSEPADFERRQEFERRFDNAFAANAISPQIYERCLFALATTSRNRGEADR